MKASVKDQLISFNKCSSYIEKIKYIFDIKDEYVLLDIVLDEAQDLSIRKTALDGIVSQQLLYEIASHTKDFDLINSIIPRMKSKSYLQDLKKVLLKRRLDHSHRQKINEVLNNLSNSISFIFDD